MGQIFKFDLKPLMALDNLERRRFNGVYFNGVGIRIHALGNLQYLFLKVITEGRATEISMQQIKK